jgi:SAM-dependent methyltransferase
MPERVLSPVSSAMYSTAWFDTFSRAVPPWTTEGDVAAVTRYAPLETFPALLDVGCGVGRTAGPLAARGYRVTGLDVSIDALREARRTVPGMRLIAMDQRHIGLFRWTFDAAVILWNSIGFGTRGGDLDTLRGLRSVLRPGGRVLLDLYHPGWLADHELNGVADAQGVSVRRWLQAGRCMHEIRYRSGSVDDIQFNVYHPEEMRAVAAATGFLVERELVWWNAELRPGPEHARYQMILARPARSSTGSP